MLAPAHPLQLAIGLIVWFAWFVALYGGLSVGCALAPPDASLGARTWLNGLLAALTAITFAWLAWQMRRCWRAGRSGRENASSRRFITTLGASLYAAAAVSTLVIGIPTLGLPPCP